MRKEPTSTFLLLSILIFYPLGRAYSQARPADYPTRAIETVIQYPAGGGSDIFVRSLMMPARKYLKVPINITNLPGRGGVKASSYVLSQPADGYTLYNFSPEQLINTIFGLENYREFSPVCNVQQDQGMLFVRMDSSFKAIQDMIRYGRENPGRIQISGTTSRSQDELIVKFFAKKAGFKVRYVPFESAPEAHASVLGGTIDVLYEEPGVIVPLLDSKKLRPLLVFLEKRLERFPDTPTATESGYEITLGRWRGLCVKRRTSQEIISYLADVFKNSKEDHTYKAIEQATLVHFRQGWKGPEEFGRFWEEEYARYVDMFRELGYLDRSKKKYPPVKPADQDKAAEQDKAAAQPSN